MQASMLRPTTSSSSQWPAAVSPRAAGVVAGPLQAGQVLGVFPTCVYLGLARHDDVVALLARDAVALPIGLRLGVDSGAIQWGVSAGDPVEVGAGRVRLPAADIVAARFQPASQSRVVTSCHPQSRVLTSCRAADARNWALDVGAGLGEQARELAASALAGLPLGALLGRMVGAGPGLTPSGDDAICGVLLTLRGAGALAAVQALGAELRSHHRATTSISAALLGAAADGYAAPQVVELVDLMFHPGSCEPTDRHELDQPPSVSTPVASEPGSWRSTGPGSLEQAVRRVLAIGHSSGRDLVTGIAAAQHALFDITTGADTIIADSINQEAAHHA